MEHIEINYDKMNKLVEKKNIGKSTVSVKTYLQAEIIRHYNIIREYETTVNFRAMDTSKKLEC